MDLILIADVPNLGDDSVVKPATSEL